MAGYSIDINICDNNKLYFAHDLDLNNLKNVPKNTRNFLRDIEADSNLSWGGHFNDPVHIDVASNKQGNRSWESAKKACLEDCIRREPIFSFLPMWLSGR